MSPDKRGPVLGVASADTAPLPDAWFHGRSIELIELWERYWRCTEDASRGGGRPGVVLVHGKAGVGKTAIALEFGRRVAAQSGQSGQSVIFTRLDRHPRKGSVERSLREILQQAGLAPDGTLPALWDRYRQLTRSRQLLIILDGVSDESQLGELVPAEARCTFLAVSRQEMAWPAAQKSYLIEILSTDDAWPILTREAGTDLFDSPEATAEILELCGRLPAAIVAAGRKIASSGDANGMSTMASQLRPLKTRLDQLGRSVETSITYEYQRLSHAQRRAFRFLSLVDAPTFASWVLRPLVNVSNEEASALAAELAQAQLLEVVDGQAEDNGEPSARRYRLHPLFRAFAATQLKSEDRAKVADAELRLNAACLELCALVLCGQEADVADPARRVGTPTWIPDDPRWLSQIRESNSDWLQAEYRNVARAVTEAHRVGWWDICWCLGAYLGLSVPEGLRESGILDTLDLALDAAERTGSCIGEIRVLIAKATVLTSIEQYDRAFDALQDADDYCAELAECDLNRASELAAATHVKRAEAWLQLADYKESYEAASTALEFAESAGRDGADDGAKRVLSELAAVRQPGHEGAHEICTASASDGLFAGPLLYDDQLRAAECARRRRDFGTAERELRHALRLNYGHARRAASVRYRLARLFLEQADRAGDQEHKAKFSLRAVAFAAGALNNFAEMDNEIGKLRARAVLARSLCRAGRFPGAERQMQLLVDGLTMASNSHSIQFLAPIVARNTRVLGEYLFLTQEYSKADSYLREAVRLFDSLDDYWSSTATLRLLGTMRRQHGDFVGANAAFWQLANLQQTTNDGWDGALAELIRTAREMGHEATARDLEACSGQRAAGRAVLALLRGTFVDHARRPCAGLRPRPEP